MENKINLTAEEEKQFHDWCLGQASDRYMGTITQDRLDRLNSLGFPWHEMEEELEGLGYNWKKNNPNGLRWNQSLIYEIHKKLACLAFHAPHLAVEFDVEKNSPEIACFVLVGSKKKYYWRCQKNQSHKWKASPNSRIRDPQSKKYNINEALCPHCNKINKGE